MARLGGASHAVPLRKKGEQDMGDEGWLSRHGLYPWFLVISGVCLVVNLVDGMVLMRSASASCWWCALWRICGWRCDPASAVGPCSWCC